MLNNQSTGFYMPVAPANYGNDGGFGFGNGAWWLLAFLLFPMMMGGWGGMGMGGMNGLYPWLNQSNQISDGFANQTNNIALNGIRDDLGEIQTQLCGGFAGVTAAVTGAQNNLSQQMYGNQIAEMQQDFAMTQVMNQGFNSTQAQLAQCCCDNRLATCQTQNLITREAAENRAATQAGVQMILDKMCQQELDAYKRENDNLRTMVNMQNLAASQAAQTAALIADNTQQTQYIVNRVAPYPIPAYTVTNPATPVTPATASA